MYLLILKYLFGSINTAVVSLMHISIFHQFLQHSAQNTDNYTCQIHDHNKGIKCLASLDHMKYYKKIPDELSVKREHDFSQIICHRKAGAIVEELCNKHVHLLRQPKSATQVLKQWQQPLHNRPPYERSHSHLAQTHCVFPPNLSVMVENIFHVHSTLCSGIKVGKTHF